MPQQKSAEAENLNFQLLLLEILDAHPQGLTTPQIRVKVQEKASERGLDKLLQASNDSLKRRVERNLAQLCETFGERLERDDSCKPYRWRVIGQEGLLPRFLKGDSQLALYFYLHEVRTRQLLPASQQEKLQGLGSAGQNLLQREFPQLVGLLNKHLKILADPLFFEAPEVCPQVHTQLLEVLREERSLSLTFQVPGGEERLEQVVPVKLVVHQDHLHLLLLEQPDTDPQPRLLALHRILALEPGPVCLAMSFDPDSVLQSWLGTRSAQKLEMHVSVEVAEELLDRPLGSGMKLEKLDAASSHGLAFRVTTWITLSSQLAAWVRQRQESVRVLAPRRWIQRYGLIAT
ncbi:WYL domain-containing protein [Marinospirillum celere]|uniref:WYL domain-containing protein n=1 Tax=Marinospirillum celere TaxID=1122252 RepID=A0A1I1EJC8_9GAMM|nr:WYL domain-containing protein [Marinospirillum celere]SFB87214.1 WYL domain-containing protein [Marinospirillum celere]